MGKSKHREAQIIAALKQMEAGRSAAEVSRAYGVSQYTNYAWKAKYGGMEVSEAQGVKQLGDENARLKRLVADLTLAKDALQSSRLQFPFLFIGGLVTVAMIWFATGNANHSPAHQSRRRVMLCSSVCPMSRTPAISREVSESFDQ